MPAISVLTLARGRADHLANVVRGLALQSRPPEELIVAAMQREPFAGLPDTPFPVRQIVVPGEALPLSAARNAAAWAATGDHLVFLDTDCIPAPDLVGDYEAALIEHDALLMGEVDYLAQHATRDGLDFDRFAATAIRHSDRLGRPGQRFMTCHDYRCFWSLNFAIRRDTYRAVGGFDEDYVGYGGEDTDFGKTLDQAGVKIVWMQGAHAYHQYHPHHMPPVHHLDSVVRNAELFERKWGYRTMGHWLEAFALMGLIDNPPHAPLLIRRRPDEHDLALTRQHGHQPYCNTASVIRSLHQAADAASGAVA